MSKQLTEEQKQNRQDFAKICREHDIRAGRDKIKRYEGYRSFVIFDATGVAEGGWYNGRKWMTAKYLRACVARWVQRSFDTGKEQPDYDIINSWTPHQCGGCRWFAALDADYGFCCNEVSPNEGRITFEHGGCKEHSYYEKDEP